LDVRFDGSWLLLLRRLLGVHGLELGAERVAAVEPVDGLPLPGWLPLAIGLLLFPSDSHFAQPQAVITRLVAGNREAVGSALHGKAQLPGKIRTKNNFILKAAIDCQILMPLTNHLYPPMLTSSDLAGFFSVAVVEMSSSIV
jgi:hypothetical protein